MNNFRISIPENLLNIRLKKNESHLKKFLQIPQWIHLKKIKSNQSTNDFMKMPLNPLKTLLEKLKDDMEKVIEVFFFIFYFLCWTLCRNRTRGREQTHLPDRIHRRRAAAGGHLRQAAPRPVGARPSTRR